jgi:integration host factor subunit beta
VPLGPKLAAAVRGRRSTGEERGWTTMTKAELIDEVSKLSNLTKKETETIVNTVFDNITDALAKGDKVELRGFGSFRIRHRNSRKGRNPKTGSAVDVPEKRVPFFKVGKRLRELVNT